MRYSVGDIVEGTVTGIKPYGAFVSLDSSHNGLIHISEISERYVRDVHTFVSVNQRVRVKILDQDEDGHSFPPFPEGSERREKAFCPQDGITHRHIRRSRSVFVRLPRCWTGGSRMRMAGGISMIQTGNATCVFEGRGKGTISRRWTACIVS